jgi:glycosyltransferase involved in cell wall biosynthesis
VCSFLTTKPIHLIPYWVNQNVWIRQPRDQARAALGFDNEAYLIGSFQRDTEGRDLVSPKLEKGPDRFCDAVIELAKTRPVEVVLSGWRRQYVMRRLDEAHVKFRLFEKVSLPVMAQLYSALDLYIVSSRYEGGPQALLECAVMGVPIVSTPVGMANMLLAPESIGEDVARLEPNTAHALESVTPMMLPQGFARYRELFHAGA